jgi:hypothetical protein
MQKQLTTASAVHGTNLTPGSTCATLCADLEDRRGVSHATAKKVHAALNGGASLLLVLGLVAIFANHAGRVGTPGSQIGYMDTGTNGFLLQNNVKSANP